MGDLSNICELRGRAKEGQGCTLVNGLKYCAKRSSPRGGGHRDCTTATDVDTLVEPNMSQYPSAAVKLVRLAAAVNQVLAGTGFASFGIFADSLGAGYGDILGNGPGTGNPGTPSIGNMLKSRSFVSQFGTILNSAGIPTRSDNFIPTNVVVATTYGGELTSYQDNVVVPGDWTTTNLGPGAPFITAPTGVSSSIVLTPKAPASQVELRYLMAPNNGTVELSDAANGVLATIPTANAALLYQKVIVNRPLSSSPISVRQSVNGTNGVQVGAIIPRNTAAPAVELLNYAFGGSTTANWTSGSSPARPLNAAAFNAFTALIIALGTNDKNTGVADSVYTANSTSLINAYKPYTDVIVSRPHVMPGSPANYDAAYIAAYNALAPLASLDINFGTGVSLVSSDFFDLIHLVSNGYYKEALYAANIIIKGIGR